MIIELYKFLYTRIKVPTKKENIENLQKKLGEVLGLERAAQKAVDQLIAMKLIKSNSKDEAKEIQGEASTHEKKIQEVVTIFSEDKDVKLDASKVEESATETEEKATKTIKLKVIPQPAEGSRTLFTTHDKDALVKGIELDTYICGNCEFVLAENIVPNTYTDIVFQCPSCKSYNEISNE